MFKSMTKNNFSVIYHKGGIMKIWQPVGVRSSQSTPGHISRWYLSLTILRKRIPLKPCLYKQIFFSGQVYFYLSLDWLEIQDTARDCGLTSVASGPIPLLFPTEIIWELPLHTAAITSSRGSSPHLTTKPSINKRPTVEQFDPKSATMCCTIIVSFLTGLTTQLNAHAGTLTGSAVCRWGNLDTFCHVRWPEWLSFKRLYHPIISSSVNRSVIFVLHKAARRHFDFGVTNLHV